MPANTYNEVNMQLEITQDGDVLDGKYLKVIETDDVFKISFRPGQYIIVNNDNSGNVYFDPTNGTSLDDRIHLNPKQEIDIYIKEQNKSFNYYLNLQNKPKDGDLVIIKEPIVDSDNNETSNNYVNHIFIYNNNTEDTNDADWCELSDSYNSSNVYLDKDFLLTANIPDNMYIDPNTMEQTDGGILVKTKGKNINEAIEMIFSPEKLPEITRPDLSVQLLTKGNYLLGSEVPINFKAEFTKGNYEFGPDTNIRIGTSNVTVELYKNNQVDGTCTNVSLEEQDNKYIITGSFTSRTLNNINDVYRIRVKVTYSAGVIPKTAKGENYPDGRITSSSITKYSNSNDSTGVISTYIEGLYIGTDPGALIPGSIDIDYLKTISATPMGYATGKNYVASDVSFVVPIGTKSIIIACPSTSFGFTKIFNETANCFMDEAFGPAYQLTYTVNNVEYAYNYWIYTPADPYINTTKLIVSIG